MDQESGRWHSWRVWAWALVLLLCPALALPQSYTFARYNDAQGLTNPSVFTMAEDPQGVLWAGTQDGVFRSEGGRWVRMDGFDPAVFGSTMGMGTDPSGRLWMLFENRIAFQQGGVVHLPLGDRGDGARARMRLYVPRGGRAELDSRNYAVYVLRGTVLERVRTADGGASWRAEPALSEAVLLAHPQLRNITAIAGEEHNGANAPVRMWAGCAGEICRLTFRGDGDPEVESWGPEQGVRPAYWVTLLYGSAPAVGGAQAGRALLWARGDGRLLALDPATGKVQVLGKGVLDQDPQQSSATMTQDRDGRVLTNLGTGLARWDGARWEVIGAERGLPEANAIALYFDHKGTLWIGTLGHGLCRWLGYGEWDGWTHRQGLSSDTLWELVRDGRGTLWAATGEDVNRLDEEGRRWLPFHAGSPVRDAVALTADVRGHLWVGTLSGRVLDLDPVTGEERVAMADLGSVDALRRDREGRVWVCSEAGLYSIGAETEWRPRLETGLPPGPVSVVAQVAGGEMWAVAGPALFRRDGGEWQGVDLPAGMQVSGSMAAAKDGTLWLAGSYGQATLLHLRVEKAVRRLKATVLESVDRSLIGSATPVAVATDGRGWVWAGSESGVRVFDGRRWVAISAEDGLIWDDVDQGSFLADADGSLWVGTSGGLSHLLKPRSMFCNDVPSLLVTEARVGGQALRGNKRVVAQQRPTLTVKVASADADRPTAFAFRYQLQGLEPGWQEMPGGFLRLPLQAAGSYTLRLVAVDTRLHLQSRPVVYRFTILPVWWQRWWFRALEAVGVLLLLVALWRVSLRVVVARQHELERLVEARTRELEREKAELEEARAKLLELSRYDTLTGILNRAAIFEKLSHERARTRQSGELLAVVMADLDHFKQINDTLGHAAGDEVLRECARRFEATLRPGDSVGRYGGEELLLLVPGLRPESATVRMDELRMAIARAPVRFSGAEVRVTCSFGLAWLRDDEMGIEQAIALADEALYRAKQNGRNRVEFAEALV